MNELQLPKRQLIVTAATALLFLHFIPPSEADSPGEDLDFSSKSSSWKVKDKDDANQSQPAIKKTIPSQATTGTTIKRTDPAVAKSVSAVSNTKPKVRPAAGTCTQAQLWALACPALLTLNNRHQHDLLWCVPATPENIATEKKMLEEWWGINSRQDLLKQLTWINSGGHRAGFDRMVQLSQMGAVEAFKAKLDPKSLNEFEEGMQIVQEFGPQLGSKSLLGWDYCRYIGLCRWGTLCGYLSPDEAWAKIMPAAKLLQNSFSSWSDLGKNYLIGRHYWQPHSNLQPSFESNYKLLLSDPKSPWVTIPWKTDLSN